MPTREEILEHLKELLRRSRLKNDPDNYLAMIEGRQFILDHFGSDNHFYKMGNQDHGCQPAMAALISYVENGRYDLKSLRDEIEAEITGDILEQAEVLLDGKAHIVAPVALAGAALEEFLRAMCEANGCLPLTSRLGIEKYKAELRKKDLITKGEDKAITSVADIRNAAVHGDWQKLTEEEVRIMVRQVRLFISKHE